MDRVVGIDWATEKRNRALVALDADQGGRSTVAGLVRAPSDADVVQVCHDPNNTVVAVDIPFGWPVAFTSFLGEWTPKSDVVAPSRDEFRFRTTDQIVLREVPKRPLSVAADRIALGARLWASLVAEHDLGASVDVEGKLASKGPTLIEVYPGATVVVLGGRPKKGDTSYKKSPKSRRTLLRQVAQSGCCDLNGNEDALVSTGERSDEADAFFAALTAAIYVNGLKGRPNPSGWKVRCPLGDEVELARKEGWIFFPAPQRRGITQTTPSPRLASHRRPPDWRTPASPRARSGRAAAG